MVEMKRVTPDQYIDKLTAHKDEEYTLQLHAWQVPLLHGLIALAADHPGVKNLGVHSHLTIQEIRDWCKGVFASWGFTPEEVEFLDKMREVAQDDQANSSHITTIV